MKCISCGSKKMTKSMTAHQFDVGLDEKIVLVDVPVARCPECGEEEVQIPRMTELLHVLANAVAQKPEQLTPKEVTFLRKHLDLENNAFAELMGVSAEQARRWQRENDSAIPKTADRFLRALILKGASHEELANTAKIEERRPFRTRVRTRRNHWIAEALLATGRQALPENTTGAGSS